MVKCAIVISIAFFCMIPNNVFAQEPLPTVDTLESLVSKWVALRQEVAYEQQNWKIQKEQLEQEHDLLLKEKELLKKDITQLDREKTSAEAERAELIQREKVLKNVLQGVLPVLERTEITLKAWQTLIPLPLVKPLVYYFDKLDNNSNMNVSQRLQLILALYGEIEKLQNNVHVVKEVLKTGLGQEQEYDVIYLGMANGFCVSEDNHTAGIGKPAHNGWMWNWNPDIAEAVRKGINIYKQQNIAEFVTLPLQIDEVQP